MPSPSTSAADQSPPPLINFESPRPENGQAEEGDAKLERIGGEAQDDAVEEEDQRELEPLFEIAPLLKEEKNSEAGTVLSLRLENCGLRGQALEVLGKPPLGLNSHLALRP